VEQARKHYPCTALYTDDEGVRLLVDELGLPFEHVSTPLNGLASHNPDWWALGKVLTYSLQEQPFVHIDSDVYLWSPLPGRLACADVMAQNPEAFNTSDSGYRQDLLQQSIRAVNGWIPTEMSEYTPRAGIPRAACCGILGGRRVDFLRYYASQAIRMLEHASNHPAWPILRDEHHLRGELNMMFEQHLLVACLDYHRSREESPYAGIRIEYLFSDVGDAFKRAAEVGFTHLLGGAKQDAQVLARLENRIRTDHPVYYDRCMNYWQRSNGTRSAEFGLCGGNA
jgi:hypothetical protein